ncbi:MAG TPA: hypothetical protein VGF82_19720 [Terracidiphilus sp.]|jgi:hypothetical protein
MVRTFLEELSHCLSIAYSLLLVCIVLASGSAIHDSTAAQSLIETLAVVALALVGARASAIDVSLSARCTKGLKIAAAIPAVVMLIQILPVPIGAHSIWINANEALGRQSWGHISVDLGGTILALAYYLANISLILVSVFVTRERRRAELLLFALTLMATLTTLGLLVGKLGLNLDSSNNDVLSGISALGILLAIANIARTFETHQSDRETAEERNAKSALIAGGIGLLIGVIGLIVGATSNAALTIIFATAFFGSIEVLRRTGLAGWATGILLTTFITAAAMIIVWRYDASRALSPLLQFATASSPDAISVTQRLLSDTPWFGTGAGTFTSISPLYLELDSQVRQAPSTIAEITIALGWPMTVFLLGATIWLVIVLFRGALSRGRDAFYPAAAAAGTVLLLGQAFCDPSLLNTCVAVFGDALIGLGLAQSVSGRDRI